MNRLFPAVNRGRGGIFPTAVFRRAWERYWLVMQSEPSSLLSSVHEVVEGFRPWSEENARAQRELEKLLAESRARALLRDVYDPGHVTASAFVLSPRGDELLLIHHKKLGLWLQPGGHLELGDASIVAAARREVLEETGIEDAQLTEVPVDLDVHAIPANSKAPAHRHFDVRVLLVARTRDFVANEEVLAARWFPLSEIVASRGALFDGVGTDGSVRSVARFLQDRSANL